MIEERFRERFGVSPSAVASAPGRVNLIGEHTDYNDGFVLPIAIDRRIEVAVSRRDDTLVSAISEAFDERRDIDMHAPPRVQLQVWDRYVSGMARGLAATFGRPPGVNLLVSGGIPLGAGLSSSAALEMAVARAICAAADYPWEPLGVARLAQSVEADYAGVRCGIMDQVAVAQARTGHAMLLDCRSLDMSHVRIPDRVAVVVMDTGVRRSLSSSEYNDRHAACDAAVSILKRFDPSIRALRDATPHLLRMAEAHMDPTVFRRALHVVRENRRPAELAAALRAGDFAAAGRLMNESHESLRDLYQVSSPHLDIMCAVAREHSACHGARMTGAGFGGSAIALVDREEIASFVRSVQPRYEGLTYKKSDFYAVSADEGVVLRQ